MNQATTSNMLSSTIALLLETAIQRGLQHDPSSRIALGKLPNLSLSVYSREPSIELLFICNATTIHVLNANNEKGDSHIYASSATLLRLILTENTSLSELDIDIEGNLSFAQQFMNLFKQQNIDWEGLLADYLGDSSAHTLSLSLQHAKQWLSGLANKNVHQSQTETGVITNKSDVTQFIKNVDNLQMNYDRIDARVKQLQKTLNEV